METIDSLFEQGQISFFDTVKYALYNTDDTIFERLDFDNDKIYSEPMLYSYFSHKEKKICLDQILFGYFNEENKPRNFSVHTDINGLVYLPNYGYLNTIILNSQLNLKYINNEIFLFFNNEKVFFEFEPLIFLNLPNKIELTNSIDLLSLKFFYNWRDVDKDDIDNQIIKNEVDLNYYKSNLEEAFEILKNHFFNEYTKYLISTRKIVLFSNPKLRNFAVRESHGTVYLNVNIDSNVSFFLEELVHQCSHTIFNAVTFDANVFFRVNSDLELKNFINKNDTRSLYGAFHGIYTTGQIVDLFLKLVKLERVFDNEMKYEIIGRLAININRVNIGLEQVSLEEVFTEKGKEIFIFLNNKLIGNIENNPSYFEFDMKTHPVVFNYNKFKKDNPINKNYKFLS